jgi:hypothetical protein
MRAPNRPQGQNTAGVLERVPDKCHLPASSSTRTVHQNRTLSPCGAFQFHERLAYLLRSRQHRHDPPFIELPQQSLGDKTHAARRTLIHRIICWQETPKRYRDRDHSCSHNLEACLSQSKLEAIHVNRIIFESALSVMSTIRFGWKQMETVQSMHGFVAFEQIQFT